MKTIILSNLSLIISVRMKIYKSVIHTLNKLVRNSRIKTNQQQLVKFHKLSGAIIKAILMWKWKVPQSMVGCGLWMSLLILLKKGAYKLIEDYYKGSALKKWLMLSTNYKIKTCCNRRLCDIVIASKAKRAQQRA